VLALCAPNSIEFAVTSYAALSAGAILTTVNPIATGEEIVHQLRQTGARWLVTTAGLFAAKLGAAARASGIAETFVIDTDAEAAPGARRFEMLRSGGENEAPLADLSPSDVAFLLSSSGTTGRPKSVVLSHRNLVANLCQMRLVPGVTEDDVVIAALRLSGHAEPGTDPGRDRRHPPALRTRPLPARHPGLRRDQGRGRAADRAGPHQQRAD
jgi:acyl-CoA synthetase (AMP-forming)/AMP-acid ligase II